MKALFNQPATQDTVRQKQVVSQGRSPQISSLSSTAPLLQRQCACGGGCPRCQEQLGLQTKLTISEPGDQYEQEADRIADEVMRMPEPSVQRPMETEEDEEDKEEEMVQRKIADPITPFVQRQVLPEMDEEEEEVIQTKTIGSQPAPSAPTRDTSEAPPSVHEVLRSPGQPLDPATRAFMEPRFGYDFSHVRVHTGAAAERSARDVNAHAYTVGRDIVFGAGRFALGAHDGRRLLAHELTHVLQEGSGVRRMTLGSGKAPQEAPDLLECPDKERSRVLAAIARVREVAKNPKGYANCHRTYAETCPGGSASSLEKAFDTAVLWRSPPGQRLGAGATTLCGTGIVAYTDNGYDGGEASLAFDLLHELGHVCGISCPEKPHFLADKLALYCMGPQERDADRQLTLRLGRSTEDWALILSYGWLLHEWREGRLSLRVNTEFNIVGALQGLKDVAGDRAAAGEIGGVTFDVRTRPFSGEHFGGLSFHAGLGGQFGRFRVRPPTDGDPAYIRSDAALVVEVGSRIEWWIKNEAAIDSSGEVGRVKPRAIDFSYRMIQPATTGAQRAHEFLGSWIIHF
jgi:hypothetical protein